MMKPTPKRVRLAWEYGQVQQDLNALLNPPKRARRPLRFWNTVKYLQQRLEQLEQQLQETA